jgi:hypothetical protein
MELIGRYFFYLERKSEISEKDSAGLIYENRELRENYSKLVERIQDIDKKLKQKNEVSFFYNRKMIPIF